MLSELHIRDFAIINDLNLEFEPGLIVFTGETGAGKSIIIDAVEMILGGWAESVSIRAGVDRAIIEGTFQLSDPIQRPVAEILKREGLLDDPAYVTLGREIRREGRNICRVNGRMVTLAVLREIGDWLVDVHGQSQHLSLLRVPEHIGMVDRYARLEGLLEEYADQFRNLLRVREELQKLRTQERDAAAKADLLSFQINEIEASSLRAGEDQALAEERTRLSNAEQLAELARQALSALEEAEGRQSTAVDLLGVVAHALAGLVKIDPSVQAHQGEAQTMVEMASNLARALRDYLEGLEFNPRRLDEVEERLGLIRDLQRKYGDQIEAILAFAERAKSELDAITHAEERMAALEAEEQVFLDRLGGLALELSEARRKAGEQLASGIDAELRDLRMSGAQFGVEQHWQDQADGVLIGDRRVALYPTGIDRIEFLVAPNPGEGLKPMVKIASGGETTRLMLALKHVLARADRTPTLIFDEIDQGIGGRIGAIVGRKLWRLAREHQVLCVTHLPQLAAFGDQHFRVEKQIMGGRTITLAQPLEGEQRISELAQMLGGETETNRESAQALLQEASRANAVIQM
jgi:DNA repair protein RecN (Recombination protein N)